VLVRSHDPNLVPIQMGKVEGDVINILKWWEFNVRFLWRKDHIWMNDICMKIVGMGSGNVI
jgi:hypothetical protein